MLNLIPDPEIIREETDWDKGLHAFTVRMNLKDSDGLVRGSGLGECNSYESKYRYRQGKRLCPVCENDSIIKGKPEYGGGWLCWVKKGGCGQKWTDGAEEIESQSVERVLNEDVADQRNTILKMAFKRALVAASLGIGFVSEVFTQDLDDMRDYHPDDGEGYTVEAAAPAQQPVPQASRPEPQPARQTRRPAPAKAQSSDDRGPELSQMEIDNLLRVCTANGVDPKAVKYIIQDHFGLDSWKKLDKAQYDELVKEVIPARGNAPVKAEEELPFSDPPTDGERPYRPHRTNRQPTAYPSRENEIH